MEWPTILVTFDGQDAALSTPVTLRKSASTSVSSCSATWDAAASRQRAIALATLT
jgi:hypothetical protein